MGGGGRMPFSPAAAKLAGRTKSRQAVRGRTLRTRLIDEYRRRISGLASSEGRFSFTPCMSDKSRFHFTGICGTAMGSVAAAMKQRGFVVTGSDANVYPPMSDFLRDQGIPIAEGYHEKNIPADADVVVIGNAISRGNPEAEAALNRKLLYHSLPEVMKEHFLRGKRNFVVSGTSSMVMGAASDVTANATITLTLKLQ